jgi:hypothetical protein
MLLTHIEGMMKEKSEFQRLEDLVTQVYSFIMINKSGVKGQFSEDDKLLIRELFGIKPGENPE